MDGFYLTIKTLLYLDPFLLITDFALCLCSSPISAKIRAFIVRRFLDASSAWTSSWQAANNLTIPSLIHASWSIFSWIAESSSSWRSQTNKISTEFFILFYATTGKRAFQAGWVGWVLMVLEGQCFSPLQEWDFSQVSLRRESLFMTILKKKINRYIHGGGHNFIHVHDRLVGWSVGPRLLFVISLTNAPSCNILNKLDRDEI